MLRALRGVVLSICWVLSACGGGGSGGGGGGSGAGEGDASAITLRFTPETLEATLIQGQPQPLKISATLNRLPTQSISVVIVDAVGVLQPVPVLLTQTAGTSFEVGLTPRVDLELRDYSGTLQIKFCLDAPSVCNLQLPGSPYNLPFMFSVVPPPAARALPDRIALTADEDEVPMLPLRLRPESGGTHYLQVVDTAGVFQFPTQATLQGGDFDGLIGLNPALRAGSYKGELELRYCVDASCSAQRLGSPIKLPYDITLRTTGNLKPLARLAGVPEWTQHQGNAAHTGYVPVTLDTRSFSKRWRWSLPNPHRVDGQAQSPDRMHPVATAGNAVFVVPTQGQTVHALSELDRSQRWSKPARPTAGFVTYEAGAPATTDGAVYLAYTSGLCCKGQGLDEAGVASFDASSGLSRFRTIQEPQQDDLPMPTLANGRVYAGWYWSLQSFDDTQGVAGWIGRAPDGIEWMTAVDAQYAYMLVGSNALLGVDARTGEHQFTINPDQQALEPFMDWAAPMVAGPNNVVAMRSMPSGRVQPGHSGRLTSFDISARAIRWQLLGPFLGAPAAAKGVIYVMTDREVQARSAADGSLLWAWAPEETTRDPFLEESYRVRRQSMANVIVTDNMLFVSSITTTYAVDLATRKTVWTYPKAGRLAISPNGILYIVTSGSSDRSPDAPRLGAGIYAINLQ